MKISCSILLLLFCVLFKAQQKNYQLIDVENNQKTVVKDSLSAVKFLDSLSQNNYFFIEVKKVEKKENITEIYFHKGKNFNQAQVTVPAEVATFSQLKTEFFNNRKKILKMGLKSPFFVFFNYFLPVEKNILIL